MNPEIQKKVDDLYNLCEKEELTCLILVGDRDEGIISQGVNGVLKDILELIINWLDSEGYQTMCAFHMILEHLIYGEDQETIH